MLIALTGGIGSGKSTCLELFKSFNCKVLDTDTMVHELYANDSELAQKFSARWGTEVITEGGSINRPKIAEIVFNNKEELSWLNSEIHPRIYNMLKSLPKDILTVVAIPLLYENKREALFDKVISVWTSAQEQKQRLLARDWSEEQISGRLNAQMHQDEKLHKADYGIINTFSKESLKQQIQIILNNLQNT